MGDPRSLRCPGCGSSSPGEAQFCGQCGQRLRLACQACSALNPHHANFCGHCGAALGAAPQEESSGGADRRQLTVVFCDLVDSTSLAERLDLEELRDLIREYQAICAAVVERYGGHIAQYLGDGLLIYFGYPTAHEEDPRRAVEAALEIVRRVRNWDRNRRPAGDTPVCLRIGIHTGPVVAGEVGAGQRTERLALGQTPNVAARLQSLATEDSVVLSQATAKLVQGFFDCRALGSHSLKGVTGPVEVFQALRPSGVTSPFELAIARGLVPMVDRRDELAKLLESYREAHSGKGLAVLLVGEGGLGKSRLLQELRTHAETAEAVWLLARCSALHQRSAFFPLIDLMRRHLDIHADGSREEGLRCLREALGRVEVPSAESLPLLAELLALPTSDLPTVHLTPDLRRQRTEESLAGLLFEGDVGRPLVFVVEDLHWADPSTLQFLDLVLGRLEHRPLLVLLSTRQRSGALLREPTRLLELPLERLTEAEGLEIAGHVAGATPLPAGLLQEVARRTDGVPLFIEELTRNLVEAGDSRERWEGGELLIPMTLQGSLGARLDQLGAAKGVLQVASVLGREFSFELLGAMGALGEEALDQHLRRAVDAGVLAQRGDPPTASYTFNHALTQEAAYGSLLSRERTKLHRLAARVMTELFPQAASDQPELVAHHFSAGGAPGKAIEYWQRAASRALIRAANLEAIDHLRHALALIPQEQNLPDRTQKEVVLQSMLGSALSAVEGFSSRGVERAYSRALELAGGIPDEPELFWLLWGLWAFYSTRADFLQAKELAEQLDRMGRQHGPAQAAVGGLYAVAHTAFGMGQIGVARQALDEALAIESTEPSLSYALPSGVDLRVSLRSLLGIVLWVEGSGDRARRYAGEALEMARGFGLPFSLMGALAMAASTGCFLGDPEVVGAHARELLALSRRHGFHLEPQAEILLGWSLVKRPTEVRDRDRGKSLLTRGIEVMRASGHDYSRSMCLSFSIENCLDRGELEEARRHTAEALSFITASGERWLESELWRLRGEQRARSPAAPKLAERCFSRALRVARRQGARALELRAAVSQARLWYHQQRPVEARQLLAPLVAALEGRHQTPDLAAARELLEELG